MKEICLIVFLSFGCNCFCQRDTINVSQFDSLFKTTNFCELEVSNTRFVIKLINTFQSYRYCIDDPNKVTYSQMVNCFEKHSWLNIKHKYGFELSVGGGYFSEQLNITYGGSIPNDYFIVKEFYDCLEKSKEKYNVDW